MYPDRPERVIAHKRDFVERSRPIAAAKWSVSCRVSGQVSGPRRQRTGFDSTGGEMAFDPDLETAHGFIQNASCLNLQYDSCFLDLSLKLRLSRS
jgi:hypothetical protein